MRKMEMITDEKNKNMKRTINKKNFFASSAWRLGGAVRRAAAMLLMMVLTATTAWAELTVDDYTFTTGSDDDGEYYVVNSKDAFEKLAAYVEGGGATSGKRFKMTNNISVSETMVGTSGNPFCGTFDGGGNSLQFMHGLSATNTCGPFRYVNDATFKNIIVVGTLCTSGKYAGGLIGCIVGGTVRINNCRIKSIIYTTYKGESRHGGLVGKVLSDSYVYIRGCVFNGRFFTGKKSPTKSTGCAGFIGANAGKARLYSCLYRPNTTNYKSLYNHKYTNFAELSHGTTFVHSVANSEIIISNCYYTKTLGTAQGYKCHYIMAGENIAVDFSGNGTVYDVSGITAYAKGMEYDGKLIAGASQKVGLTLGHNDPEGQSFLGYSVSSGTLSGTTNPYELTMPDVNVTVSGKWLDLSPFGTANGADGTAEHPYTITTTDGLDHLASLVNGGTGFAGKYFKLDADIAYDKNTENNYTPIGKSKNYFKGTFDGRGYVVSGININRPSEKYQALFGWVSGGSLRNIIVTDATITGLTRVGAVVGFAPDSHTIENCYYRNVTFGGARDNEGDRVRALQTLTLGENISTSTTVTKTIGDTDYYAEGTTVELSYSGTVNDGEKVTYAVNGELIDGNKFSMPAKDVTVSAQTGINYAYYWGEGDGLTAATPYVISNVTGLNLLAMSTRGGETFAGKYFELGRDIDLSDYDFNGIPADFNGTFDGKGKTISGIDINGTDGAGFFYRLGGTVQNLTLQGKVTISGGEEASNTARVGGIALLVNSGGSITGCQSLLSITGGLNAEKGGVAGKNEGTVTGCHYLGTCSAAGSSHSIEAVGSGTAATDCTPLYLLEGLDSETLGTVEVTSVVSDGAIYGGCYHAAGSELTLTLTATEKEDYDISGYYYIDNYDDEVQLTANSPSGDGGASYTLTMPSMDVTIEAKYSYDVLAAVTKDNQGRYLVKTMDDLRAVAKASLQSDLNGCMGMTFLLDNDIENAGDFSGIAVTPAGSSTNYSFYGTFDGGGHTISGLNIVSDVETVGFIGSLDEIYGTNDAGTLKNLTLKNCTVTNIYYGKGYVGMLVGSCNGGKLENCRVLGGSVMASSDQDPEDEDNYRPSSAGAIAGYCILGAVSKDNYYDQKVGVFVDGEPQTPGKCGTGDPTDALAQAMVITLADDDDNSSDIWTFRGVAAEDNGEEEGEGAAEDIPEFLNKSFEVTLTGRTLWKDGKWNTLCLPFSLASLTGTPLEGATVKTLTSSTFADGALTLDFTEDAKNLTSIEAGKPYIIKWAPSSEHIVNPVFQGVTLDATDRSVSFNLGTEGQEKGITFCGTYDAMAFDAAEPSILFLGGANTLYYPESGAKIGAQRAYFQLDGLTAGESSSPNAVRAFKLSFGDQSTGIREIDTDPAPSPSPTGVGRNAAWYTLDGRKLSGKPTKSGVYIHNGRKVVIK